MMSEVSSTKYTSSSKKEQYVEPKFTMIQEPNNSTPQYLVFEIALPNQVLFLSFLKKCRVQFFLMMMFVIR